MPKGDSSQAHAVTFKAGNGGIQTGDSARGFANRIDYSVNALWGSSCNALVTSAITGQSTLVTVANGAFAGALQIQVVITLGEANTLPLRQHLLT